MFYMIQIIHWNSFQVWILISNLSIDSFRHTVITWVLEGGRTLLWKFRFQVQFFDNFKLSINTFRYQVLQLITGLVWPFSSCFCTFYSIFFIFKTKSTAPSQYKKRGPPVPWVLPPLSTASTGGTVLFGTGGLVLSSMHWHMIKMSLFVKYVK